MELLELADAPVFPGAGNLNARSLRDSALFGMLHFTLHPGGIIPMHNLPFEVCFLVLAGKGTLSVKDQSHQLAEGHIAACLPLARRSWRNYSIGEDLKVLVIKLKENKEQIGDDVEVRRIQEMQPAKNPHGIDVKKVYESEYALASIITLKPGEKLNRHVTPVDVFFYVIKGTGVVEVGDEKQTVSADTVIDSPKNIPHCWYNESESDLRVLVVKVPKPSSDTKLL